MVAGAVVQMTARSMAHYIAARVILGFGIPTCIVAGSALIGELAYPKERAIMTSLFNVAYYVGSVIAACMYSTLAAQGSNEILQAFVWGRTTSRLTGRGAFHPSFRPHRRSFKLHSSSSSLKVHAGLFHSPLAVQRCRLLLATDVFLFLFLPQRAHRRSRSDFAQVP